MARALSKPLALSVLAAALLALAPLLVRAAKVDEAKIIKVQAGCIYQLARLTNWPDNRFEAKDSPFVISFIGDDTFAIADYFQSQADKYSAQGRKIVVEKHTYPSESASAAGKIAFFKKVRQGHIVYVGKPPGKLIFRDVLDLLAKADVLTVGGSPEFTDIGGMIALTVENEKLVIRANLAAVASSKLKVSAQILQHAIIVKK